MQSVRVNFMVWLWQFIQTLKGRRGCGSPASALILLRVVLKAGIPQWRSHKCSWARPREASQLIEHSRSAQPGMSDMGRGTPGKQRGQPPRFSKEGCRSSRCPGTLICILGTTWEVSVIKSRSQRGKRILSVILPPAPGFLSAYGMLFLSVWRLSRKPELIKDISTFRHRW